MASGNSDFLGTAPVRPLLFKLAWPAIVSMVINMLYNMVDRAYIGNGVGTEALAGLALTMPLMVLLAAFGMMGGVGTGAIISILLGEKKKHEAECALGQLILLCLLSIVTLQSGALFYLDDMLAIFGGNDTTIPYARDYLRIILWGSIFQHLSFSVAAQMRAEGNSKKCMVTIIIGAVTNIILDPIFIFSFNLGIKGAAYATIISMMFSSTFALWHFIRGKGSLQLHWKNLRPNIKMILRIISIGLAPCCIQIAASTINIIVNQCFKNFSSTEHLANEGIACWSIVTSLYFVAMTPMFGIGHGLQPIIGYNLGAKLWDRMRLAYKTAVLSGLGLCVVFALLSAILAPYLVRCFSNSQTMVDTATSGLRTMMITFPLIAVDVMNIHFFQATGRAKFAIYLSLQRQFVFFAPTLMLLSRFAGITYIWFTQPISDAITFAISSSIAFYILRDLKRKALSAQNHE